MKKYLILVGPRTSQKRFFFLFHFHFPNPYLTLTYLDGEQLDICGRTLFSLADSHEAKREDDKNFIKHTVDVIPVSPDGGCATDLLQSLELDREFVVEPSDGRGLDELRAVLFDGCQTVLDRDECLEDGLLLDRDLVGCGG